MAPPAVCGPGVLVLNIRFVVMNIHNVNNMYIYIWLTCVVLNMCIYILFKCFYILFYIVVVVVFITHTQTHCKWWTLGAPRRATGI